MFMTMQNAPVTPFQ